MVHCLNNYIFVIKLNWGIQGTGVAGAITQASSTLIIYSYSY